MKTQTIIVKISKAHKKSEPTTASIIFNRMLGLGMSVIEILEILESLDNNGKAELKLNVPADFEIDLIAAAFEEFFMAKVSKADSKSFREQIRTILGY